MKERGHLHWCLAFACMQIHMDMHFYTRVHTWRYRDTPQAHNSTQFYVNVSQKSFNLRTRKWCLLHIVMRAWEYTTKLLYVDLYMQLATKRDGINVTKKSIPSEGNSLLPSLLSRCCVKWRCSRVGQVIICPFLPESEALRWLPLHLILAQALHTDGPANWAYFSWNLCFLLFWHRL